MLLTYVNQRTNSIERRIQTEIVQKTGVKLRYKKYKGELLDQQTYQVFTLTKSQKSWKDIE